MSICEWFALLSSCGTASPRKLELPMTMPLGRWLW